MTESDSDSTRFKIKQTVPSYELSFDGCVDFGFVGLRIVGALNHVGGLHCTGE